MNTNPILLTVLLGAFAACHNVEKDTEFEAQGQPRAFDVISNASLNNAIVSQHTLYAYHFANGSGVLNELGLRDLNVLVDHFLKAGGNLNVHRGEASPTLYDERVKTVLEHLAAAGVQSGAVSIQDGLPGGEGLASERVIVILKEKMAKGSNISNVGGGGSGSSGSTTIQ